jgi:hypothetical protein
MQRRDDQQLNKLVVDDIPNAHPPQSTASFSSS